MSSFTIDDVSKALQLPDEAEEGHLHEELFQACASGDAPEVAALITKGADVRYQEADAGLSALMIAAVTSKDVVKLLLQHGAPWNAQSKDGQSAGDRAIAAEQQEIADTLLEWACLAEQCLRSTEQASDLAAENRDYLQQSLTYDGDTKLMDANGEAVMMDWERPLMLAHANLICQNGGDVLNVGFGLGLVDDAIQTYNVASHTIIEAHPDVYKHMLALGWDKRPGVRILFGRWQDVADQLTTYDGIFFDTYSEHYEHMREFHALLPRILKPSGIYSFFNGLAPRCAFFHTVYCRIVTKELGELGLETQYMELPVQVDQKAEWDEKWEGVRNRYWFHRSYNLPIVYWQETEESA